MSELRELISLYFDAYPEQKADTTERLTKVEELGRDVHAMWALLPVKEVPIGSGDLPALELDEIHAQLVLRGAPFEWTLSDVFGVVYPSASNIQVKSYTYVPQTPLSSGESKLAFRLHQVSGPGLPFTSYMQAVQPLRRKLAEIDSIKAQIASDQTQPKDKTALRAKLKTMNAAIMERRYKMVIQFVDLMDQSGAYDDSVAVDMTGTQAVRMITVRDRVAAVLRRIQGCPSFEPVAYVHSPEASALSGWDTNFIVVPRLSKNLVPLRKLAEAKCKLTIPQKLDFILQATSLFKTLLHCIMSRHVVWLTPRLDAVYANLNSAKQLEYLVAPATQLYNMFAVNALPPGAMPLSEILEEFVAELFYELAAPGKEPWNTLNVNNVLALDVEKLRCLGETTPGSKPDATPETTPDSTMLSEFKTKLRALFTP